ncbi:hypothetical protein IGI04_029933 [Brassica rapa subsp. trilocularis]|uniref:Uncharacterized protein n=1 Tax=Brassica rapa subsp. trilocularis TaxID=1813537 RepID=A0ABQ7LQ40_BRACM|nr:hypothetical protein IGI04_029933 [Brassica rapa subsp. trilocularis]
MQRLKRSKVYTTYRFKCDFLQEQEDNCCSTHKKASAERTVMEMIHQTCQVEVGEAGRYGQHQY